MRTVQERQLDYPMSTTDWKTQTEIANETGKILVNTNDNNDRVYYYRVLCRQIANSCSAT